MDYIIISETQLKHLTEIAVEKVFRPKEIKDNILFRRCYAAELKGIERSPWCKLSFMYKTELDEPLQKRLIESLKVLLQVYKKKLDTGILPMIIELCLQDRSRTVNDLETIADFLVNPEYNTDAVKRQLTKLSKHETLPSDESLKEILKLARYKEYTNYENSFDGKHFEPKKTFLKFEHRCEKEMDDKFFNLIKDIQVSKKEVTEFLYSFTKCIKSSMDSQTNPIKADKFLKENLYYIEKDENGNEVKKLALPAGNYEVKKLDPMIDSYLSEFFSIFKESGLKNERSTYLETYNKIVQCVFEWIETNDGGYKERVESNMQGVIFNDNIIVPMKYIELYWSNKSRSCEEKRISIRFRLNPKYSLNEIEAYKYTLNSDIVEKYDIKKLSSSHLNREKEICR